MAEDEAGKAVPFHYVGDELKLFEQALNWKRYWSRRVRPYLGRTVIEVGAGIGANTALLCKGSSGWTAIEPDPVLSHELQSAVAQGRLPPHCRTLTGQLADLPVGTGADTVLYIDVLEHIEDDQAEFTLAASHLRPGGHLVVLSPAHPWLYSPFDAAVGHHRRYNRASLGRLHHPTLRRVAMAYIDSVGLLASLANRLVLQARMPTQGQILTWDRYMVPLSVRLDPLLGGHLGKSILGVWVKQ